MTVGIGVIGAGIMGERLLRAAAEASHAVRVTGVWDRDGAALDRVAGLGVRAASAEAVVAGADCIYVATPPGTHLSYARQALAAGKSVFLEKPLAVDVHDAARFVDEAGVGRVAVNFPFASSPAVERLRSWLEGGVSGAPRGFAIDVAFKAWPRAWQHGAAPWLDGPAEGGFMREVVSHFLFLSRRLLGPLSLRSQTVEMVPGGTERRVAARIEAGGLPGRLTGAVAGDAEDYNTWTVRGVADMRLRNWSVAERQRPDGTWAADPDALPHAENRSLVLRRQLEGVAAMVRGEAHSLATVSEAFEVQRVVEAVLGGRAAPGAVRPE